MNPASRKKQTAPRSQATPKGGWTDLVICGFLLAIAWIVYGRTLGDGFVNYDDNLYVYNNPQVIRGLTYAGFAWAFTYRGIGHWHPITWLSHMLDCQVHGAQPWGQHLTNVLLHAAAATLLFLVFRRMTGVLWRSAFVAAVFAVHPLHVESVAWISERKDVLSGVFFMLTLGAHARYARQPDSRARYFLVIALFAAGLMSKGMLVTLPFLLLLLDWWPLHRITAETPGGSAVAWREIRASALPLMVEKIPLFLLSAASCIITSLAPEDVPDLSFSSRLGNAIVSCAIYLRQMVWPTGLAIPYPYPANGRPAWEVALSLAMLAAISILVFVFGKKRPWLIVGWLWYLGMLVPVIGVVQISYYSHADRYTYLPQIGLYLLLAWTATDLVSNLPHRRPVLAVTGAVIVAALMLLARAQTAYWENNQTLWNHTLAVTDDNVIALNNLGNDLLQKGQADEAITNYEKAIQIDPSYTEALLDLGNAFLQKGEMDRAMGQYQKTLGINPRHAEAHSNLGFVLHQEKRLDEAIAQYLEALEIKPDMLETRLNLGVAFQQKGELDKALDQFQKAVDINPDSPKALNDLGLALLQSGNVNEAILHLQRALEIEPDYAEARYNLDLALRRKDQ